MQKTIQKKTFKKTKIFLNRNVDWREYIEINQNYLN